MKALLRFAVSETEVVNLLLSETQIVRVFACQNLSEFGFAALYQPRFCLFARALIHFDRSQTGLHCGKVLCLFRSCEFNTDARPIELWL
jgi:hypothetical protein